MMQGIVDEVINWVAWFVGFVITTVFSILFYFKRRADKASDEEIVNLRGYVESVDKDVKNVSKEVRSMEAQMKSLEGDVKELRSKVESVKENQDRHTKILTNITETLADIRVSVAKIQPKGE